MSRILDSMEEMDRPKSCMRGCCEPGDFQNRYAFETSTRPMPPGWQATAEATTPLDSAAAEARRQAMQDWARMRTPYVVEDLARQELSREAEALARFQRDYYSGPLPPIDPRSRIEPPSTGPLDQLQQLQRGIEERELRRTQGNRTSDWVEGYDPSISPGENAARLQDLRREVADDWARSRAHLAGPVDPLDPPVLETLAEYRHRRREAERRRRGDIADPTEVRRLTELQLERDRACRLQEDVTRSAAPPSPGSVAAWDRQPRFSGVDSSPLGPTAESLIEDLSPTCPITIIPAPATSPKYPWAKVAGLYGIFASLPSICYWLSGGEFPVPRGPSLMTLVATTGLCLCVALFFAEVLTAPQIGGEDDQ